MRDDDDDPVTMLGEIDLSEFMTELGQTTEDLAGAARALFHRLAAVEDHTPWQTVDNTVKGKWVKAVEPIIRAYIDRREVTCVQLSQMVASEHVGNADDFDQLPQVLRLIWEAVTRHIVNLVMARDAEDTKAIEKHDWMAWVIDRCPIKPEPQGGVEDGDE